MYTIATQADLISALSQPLAVVYKHSPICPTSGIAERVGIVHASPQAIILRAGVPAWHGSHFDLRAEVMSGRLASLKAETKAQADPA